MRPHDRRPKRDPLAEYSLAETLVVSLLLALSLPALAVALAYPVLALGFVGGLVTVWAGRKAAGLVDRLDERTAEEGLSRSHGGSGS